MPERIFDDSHLPPPGRRTGAGSASILPYLLKSLAARPQVPAVTDQGQGQAPAASVDSTGAAESRPS